MRTAAFAFVLAFIGVFASESTLAHGHARVSIGVGFGYPFWGPYPHWSPWYYPSPYYYPPAPAVVVPSQPVTYIEQGGAPAADTSNWWYYCDTSRGYYPYVRECPSGWERVPPAPAK